MSANTLSPQVCPLLQLMIDHSLNNNTKANIVLVCIHGIVSCLGILENALIIWVVGFRLQRRTVTSVWVLNLAISDFLTTLTLPLFTYYLSSNHSWELGQPLCKIQASIFFLNMFVSAFLLAAISLDRCLLVAKPVWCHNYRSVIGAWKVCILGWLWAIINTFPYFLFRSVTQKNDKRKLCYHNFAMYVNSPDTLERHCRIRQEATAFSKTFLTFLIPLVVIAGSYIQIAVTLRRRRLANMFLKAFGSAFVLCWSPYHIFCIIEVIAEYRRDKSDFVQVGLPLATTFAFLNPVLNPILYAFSCPNFCIRIRQSLGAVFDGLVEEGGGILLVPGKTVGRNRGSSGKHFKVINIIFVNDYNLYLQHGAG
uniref:G-protein coupled receptors family 1 profile domain-containing protein n=1 Tax=Periophthalmus magnuspinnatus TaxID=409849 RepID=A0A3B3ZU36_9GOBI